MLGVNHRRGAFVRLFAFVLLLGVSPAALAQELEDGLEEDAMADAPPPPQALSVISSEDDMVPVVRRRAAPVEEETGLRLGSFIASPEFEIGVIGTSNAARAYGDDLALALRPSLNLESDWSRHSVRFDASADLVRYLDNGALDSNGVAVSAASRIDVRRTTQIEFEAGYALTATAPSDVESAGSPIEGQDTHAFTSASALTHDFGGVTGRLRLSGLRQTYEDVRLNDGTTELNGDRDFVEGQISARATLNSAAHLRPFAEVALNGRVHDKKRDRNGLRRDSFGVTGSVGLTLDDDPIWSGEVALRSVLRDYADPSFSTQTAIGLAGSLQWRPREGTTIAVASAVEIAETISATEGGARSWDFAVDGTQAIRNNLDLTAGASVNFSDALTGTDVEYGWSAGLEWAINPIVTARLGYDGSWLDAATRGDNALENRVLASIVLAP